MDLLQFCEMQTPNAFFCANTYQSHLPVYLAQNTDTLALTTARLLDRDALGEIARLIHVAT
jgi:hypothetical protein